jgi:hypothetical protein
MNSRRIVIDGKSYDSVDEMPEDVRQKYEEAIRALKNQGGKLADMLADKDQNGVPDILENQVNSPIVKTTFKFHVNGKEVTSLDDLPPEARAKFEQAMSKLDANHNGIPDFAEGMMGSGSHQTAPVATFVSSDSGIESIQPTSFTQTPVNSAITPDTSNGWMLGLLVLGLLFICAVGAAGIWYFFLR